MSDVEGLIKNSGEKLRTDYMKEIDEVEKLLVVPGLAGDGAQFRTLSEFMKAFHDRVNRTFR